MSRLQWGVQNPEFNAGVDNGVLYLAGKGVAWNGLVSVDEQETTVLVTEHYFDGVRVHISEDIGDFKATLSAYTYPDAFAEYNGYSEEPKYGLFGLSYRTQLGEQRHQYHLVYGVSVREQARSWKTLTNQIDPSLFAWDIQGQQQPIQGAANSSRLTLETPSDPYLASKLEDILYGTATTEPRLPSVAELVDLYETYTRLTITYNGDGTYTASGPDDMVEILDNGRFRLTSPSAHILDEDIFVVNSY